MILWFVTLAHAADTPVSVSALPAPVTVALNKRFPTAHAVSASKDGAELEVEMAEGARQFTAVFKADGTLVETEEKVELSALPDAVQKAATARGPIQRAEKRTLANGKVDYEVVVRVSGKDTEIHVDSTGVVSKEEDEGEEDDDRK